MQRTVGSMTLVLLIAAGTGCARKIPIVDLDSLDSTFVQRCTQAGGGVVGLEERYLEYTNRGYDITNYRMLSGDKTPVRRRVIRILSPAGAERASAVSVIHYREQVPDIEVHVWMDDGTPRKVNVHTLQTKVLADWPCDLSVPRRTDFRIATLSIGDTVEIIQPISGPETLLWHFGSDRFCQLHSRATFGHSSDENRPDLHAIVVDASGAVKRTSPGESYPMVFELQKPLMPISRERLPFVLLAPRCPGWSNLRGQLFHLPLWMARAGDVDGRKAVNPMLVRPVENDEKLRRIQTAARWLHTSIRLEEDSPLVWMRWMPLEPAHKTARKRSGTAGSWATLAFRILEDAGLKPRFALIHTHASNPLDLELPTTSQLDTLAVLVDDETGKTHWLVPGLSYDPEDQPPSTIRGRQALVLERWWLDREQGSGNCIPVDAVGFSCQVSTPAPVELKLLTVGE